MENIKEIISMNIDLLITVDNGISSHEAVELANRADIDVIIITGYGSIQTAVETMQFGAMNYIEKPFRIPDLKQRINKILEK